MKAPHRHGRTPSDGAILSLNRIAALAIRSGVTMTPRSVPSLLAIAAALVAATACQSTPAPRTSSATVAPAPDAARQIRLQGDFKAPLGVQLYTFRVLAKEDPVKMLQTVHRLGFTHVEGGSTYGIAICVCSVQVQVLLLRQRRFTRKD